MKRMISFLKVEGIFAVSGLLALLSLCFQPTGYNSFQYIDFRVIGLLFCLMSVIASLGENRVFQVLSVYLIEKAKGIRILSIILILLCFFSSMFITNDVALLTFVPLTLSVLSTIGQKRLIFVISMQTIAANLGSMATPIGNPQNLYLFTFYHLSVWEFLSITVPITMISLILIMICCFFLKDGDIKIVFGEKAKIENKIHTILTIGLFVLCLLTVFDLIPYGITTAIVILVFVMINIKILMHVDYYLLFTFVFFFIFVGNIRQIPLIQQYISNIFLGKELLFSVGLSQMISNVPAAVMLSAFTDKGSYLIAGTNIGGLGTIIASLASLISFKFYIKSRGANTVAYLYWFTILNIVFLIILLPIALLLFNT